MNRYRWCAFRCKPASGINTLSGLLEAHNARDAHRQIDQELKDYAEQGLIQGDWTVSLMQLARGSDKVARILADRNVFVHSLAWERYHAGL